MTNTHTFRKAVSAWLNRKPAAATKLLEESQPLTPAQSRVWRRIVETR